MIATKIALPIIAVCVTAVGAVGTYNWFADPGWRIGGARLDDLSILGPFLLAAGVVLLLLIPLSFSSVRDRESAPVRVLTKYVLLTIGAVLVLITVVVTVDAPEAITLASISFGLPGLVFVIAGAIVGPGWSKETKPGPDGKVE